MNRISKFKTTLALLWAFFSFGALAMAFSESNPRCLNDETTLTTETTHVVPEKVCYIYVTPGSTSSFDNMGGSVTVFIVSDVSWKVTSKPSWVNITGSTGYQDGSFVATAQSNPTCATRTGTIIVTAECGFAESISIQVGACCVTAAPSSLTLSAAATNNQYFNVTTTLSSTTWQVSKDSPWVSLVTSSGTGSSPFIVNFTENNSGEQRTAHITIHTNCGNTTTITVTQNCDVCISVSPTSLVGYHCASTSFNVTSNANWTVSSNAGWVSTNPTAGSNNGTVGVNVSNNTTCTDRTATLTVSATNGMKIVNKTVTVTQWHNCNSVSPTNQNVSSAAGSTSFNINTNGTAWNATTNDSWITLSPAYGPPSGIYTSTTATYTANNSNFSRTGNITITSCDVYVVVTVTQQGTGSSCSNDFETANNTRSGAPTLIVPSTKVSQIGSSSDQDYWKFVTTSASIVGLTLSNLPANYDLYVKNSSGTNIGSSTNSGNSDEAVDVTIPAGTYYAHVVGVGGAFSTTACYTLNIFPNAFKDDHISDRSGEEEGGDFGVNAVVEELDFKVYPNPTTGITEILVNKEEMVEVEVLNQMGQIVFSNQGSKRFVWDAVDLPNGVYAIRLLTEAGNVVKQVTVSH